MKAKILIVFFFFFSVDLLASESSQNSSQKSISEMSEILHIFNAYLQTGYNFSPKKRAVEVNQVKEVTSQQDKQKVHRGAENQIRAEVTLLAQSFTYYKEKKYDQALSELAQVKSRETLPYSQFIKFLVYFDLGKNKKVVSIGEKLIQKKSLSSKIKNKVLEDLFRVYMTEKKYSKAKRVISRLEKRLRFSPRHPEILAEKLALYNRYKKNQSCGVVRKLYKEYPFYEKVQKWTIQASQFQLGKSTFNCQFSFDDDVRRVKKLFWSGKLHKAEQEILTLKHPNEKKLFEADYLMSLLEERRGNFKESIKLLLPYYSEKKKDKKYINFLAKVAGSMGDLSLARRAYQSMSDNSPGAGKIHPLFYQSFLSYQYQDYDRALRGFKKVVDLNYFSKLRAEAEWYIAWIYYLKRDYKSSKINLEKLLTKLSQRYMRRSSLSREKILYWLAMSHLKSGEKQKALNLFSEILQGNEYGYYELASFHRVKSSNLKLSLNKWGYDKNQVKEAALSLSSEQISEKQSVEEESVKENERLALEFLNHPEIKSQIALIESFYHEGFTDWASSEISNLGLMGRTTHHRVLQMILYGKVKNYQKQATVSSLFFKTEKEYGLAEAKPFWESSFPRAFSPYVSESSQFFNVPEEFVLSIMRAESFYKPMAESNVGAKGLMQVMPHTARKIASLMDGQSEGKQTTLFDPERNIQLGTRYLMRLLKMFDGQMALAAASYNAGPHRVTRWLGQFGYLDSDEFIEHIPYGQTRRYVKKVIKHYDLYKKLYKSKEPKSHPLSDLAWLSEKMKTRSTHPSIYKENWDPIQF